MIILEGNIGAGKSTFLRLIKQHLPGVDVVFEPLHQWHKQDHGQSLLADFYKDPKRWAYTLETFAMACRVQEHIREQAIDNPLRVMERSIFSGHYCFAKNDYLSGYMNKLEWELYKQWFDFLVQTKCLLPQAFIYLQTQPDIAYGRVKKRQRDGETAISLAYLKQIHIRHEEFLVKKEDIRPALQSTPVLILDCNKEFEQDQECQNRLIWQVKEFIERLVNN